MDIEARVEEVTVGRGGSPFLSIVSVDGEGGFALSSALRQLVLSRVCRRAAVDCLTSSLHGSAPP